MLPVPPLPDLLSPKKIEDTSTVADTSHENAMEDLLRNCIVLCTSDNQPLKPEQVGYRHIPPILQQGPTCGLVALLMAVSLLPRKWTLKDLLEDAQDLGYSKSGEMFSVENMARFAIHVLGDYFNVEVFSGGLSEEKENIMDCLLKNEALYLVPYDADKNSSPCCLRGHKAHWALLCGAVISNGKYFVLSRQGKSKHIGMWSFHDLEKSNLNLIEISPERLSLPEQYIFHDLSTSMAGKYIKLTEQRLPTI